MENRFKVQRLVDHSGYVIHCTLTDKQTAHLYKDKHCAEMYCHMLNESLPQTKDREVNEYFV
jgi:hypothetical protein